MQNGRMKHFSVRSKDWRGRVALQCQEIISSVPSVSEFRVALHFLNIDVLLEKCLASSSRVCYCFASKSLRSRDLLFEYAREQ
jgi:hypothetical protein